MSAALGRMNLAPGGAAGMDSFGAFEEVPPAASGISWVHLSGQSPEMYLPETVGPGCGFLDYDNDGWMDIYLVNSGACDFYKPATPLRNALYRNNRDGTFTDVTQRAGVPGNAYGMGVAVGDYDGDGWPDLYVTQYPRSILYHNNGDGTFTDVTAKAGVGAPGWGTSSVWFDYDNDGRLHLFVANVDHESFALFHNNKDESFTDVAIRAGIDAWASRLSGWGLKFFDYDNDGNLDLLLCNGHPDTMVEKRMEDVTYREPMLLIRNSGSALKNVSAESGAIFSKKLAGRGLALGDFDNDGSVDVLVAQNDGAPLLLRNYAGRRNHWLGVRLIGHKANIDAIGARVVYQSGDLLRRHWKVGGGSYLSAHDPRIVLGLGQRTKIDWMEVKWPNPSGKTERFSDLPIDRYITIVEGQGSWK